MLPKPDKLLKFLQAQARGYFSLDVDSVELAAAATLTPARLFTVDAALAERFSTRQLEASLRASGKIGHYTRPLTPREQEMVQLLAMGMTNQQIADTFSPLHSQEPPPASFREAWSEEPPPGCALFRWTVERVYTVSDKGAQ